MRVSAGVTMFVFVMAAGSEWTQAGESVGTIQQPVETAKPSPKPIPKPAKGTCLQGYVWREARPSDRVCVRPHIRDEVAAQNRVKAKRWVDGPYGPQTCIDGYVWREAFSGDTVCVTPKFREQAKADNAAASARVVK